MWSALTHELVSEWSWALAARLSGSEHHLMRQGCRFDLRSGHMQEATNECIHEWNNKPVFLSLPPSLIPCQGSIPAWVCLGPAVVCEFLISCRKQFKTRVQVTFIKAGDEEAREEKGEPGLGCLSLLGSQAKGGFSDRFKGLAWGMLPAAQCLKV